MDLLPNGLKALKYLDPNAYAAVKTASLTFVNSPQSDKEQTTEASEKIRPSLLNNGFLKTYKEN